VQHVGIVAEQLAFDIAAEGVTESVQESGLSGAVRSLDQRHGRQLGLELLERRHVRNRDLV
jgi:hypothetical protein